MNPSALKRLSPLRCECERKVRPGRCRVCCQSPAVRQRDLPAYGEAKPRAFVAPARAAPEAIENHRQVISRNTGPSSQTGIRRAPALSRTTPCGGERWIAFSRRFLSSVNSALGPARPLKTAPPADAGTARGPPPLRLARTLCPVLRPAAPCSSRSCRGRSPDSSPLVMQFSTMSKRSRLSSTLFPTVITSQLKFF